MRGSRLFGTTRGSHWTAAKDSAIPKAPAIIERTTDSTKIWRIISLGLAPKAACNAISDRRREARASRRPATLAHAISRTRPTAANSIRKAGRVSPTSWSSTGFANTLGCILLVSGNWVARLLAMTSRSALAWASEAPGARRPITPKREAPRCGKNCASSPMDVHKTTGGFWMGNEKFGGIMPATV